MNKRPFEMLMWSIALPGFGQLLIGKYIKGIIFIFLEILINVQGNLNEVIILSFYGEMDKAIQQSNYKWLMFYPCLYLFAMWDAYKDRGGGKKPYSFIPFVFSAYFGTIGVIYSSSLEVFGVLFGPVFLPILFFILGIGVGILIKFILGKMRLKKQKMPDFSDN